jgi:hydroxymethylpyrimidine kinase/phosphomethylpyrimidine kinase
MRRKIPCALTIAGSDSGGGAGIQADLKTFAALGVHGTSALTCITAQNPKAVLSVSAVPVGIVCNQIKAVLAELPPRAIKTGMLYSAEIIRGVAKALGQTEVPLIVDPVMISTSGAQLLQSDAVAALQEEIFPRAALLTPNLAELEFLLRARIATPEQLRSAARELYAQCGCAVLAKGGHLRSRQAIDFYFDGRTELMLEAPRVAGVATHGTGCTYSAAITAYLCLGRTLTAAVLGAKEFISNAIAKSDKCGRHFVLNSAGA